MTQTWFEEFGFEDDPYHVREPIWFPEKRITWNRDDLDESDKKNLENFIEDISSQRAAALRIYGSSGAGKTWLLRYIEKQLELKIENPIIFYYAVVGAKSEFSEFYLGLMDDGIKPQLQKLLNVVTQKIGKDIADWKKYWEESDLAVVLHHINSEDEHKDLSKGWLTDEVPLGSLKSASITTRLSTDHAKMRTLKTLLIKASELFSACVLFIDEIALVRRGFGRELGRILKDLLDGFSEKFGLVCTYTAETSDALLDSYDEHFYRRFEYEVGLKSIKRDYLPTFLRLHHQCYRKEDVKIRDQLHPFTEGAVYKLADLMDPARHLPAPILLSCGKLAREAFRTERRIINEEFIDKNKGSIPPDSRVRP